MKNANTTTAKIQKASFISRAKYYIMGGAILAAIPAAVIIAKLVFHVNMDLD